MKTTRRVLRAGAVLIVAFAAGHFVQTIRTEQARGTEGLKNLETVSAGPEAVGLGSDPVLPATASLTIVPEHDAPASPEVASEPVEMAQPAPVILTPTLLDPAVPADQPLLAALGDEATTTLPKAPLPTLSVPETPDAVADSPALANCTPVLTLAAGARALIAITLVAPCNAGERVVLRHGGLAVAEKLNSDGELALDLPALNEAGEVSVLFSNADVASAQVPVPEAATIRRFAVQWMAGDSFQLHAMEAGATYGEPGHVSAESPVSANGGYLLSLGNPDMDLPMMAQVYTWPTDSTIPARPVVEAAVTDLTCDRELLGETLVASAGAVIVTELTVAMPGCDAVGDILVLNNLLGDVTLAAAN